MKKIEVVLDGSPEEELHCDVTNQKIDANADKRSPGARREWQIANAAGGNHEREVIFGRTHRSPWSECRLNRDCWRLQFIAGFFNGHRNLVAALPPSVRKGFA